jgi:hypothetical protein
VREQQRKSAAGQEQRQEREAEVKGAEQQAEVQRRTQQQLQASRMHTLPAHDAVHNPLFEGDSEGEALMDRYLCKSPVSYGFQICVYAPKHLHLMLA